MPEIAQLLKISQLAKRAGVGRGTIQHYLREGLLPRPVKTHRNMAYYDPACVERIRMIKELQSRRFMPLSVIRRLLGKARSDAALVKGLFEAQQAAQEALTPPAPTKGLTPRASAKAFKLRPGLIDELRRKGLVATRSVDGEEMFEGTDLEVLAAIANLDTLGFTEKLGFSADDLMIYHRAMERLLNEEIQTFARVVADRGDTGTASDLARSAIDAATMLMVAMRRKLIADLLGSANAQVLGMLAAEAGTAKRKRAAKKKKTARKKTIRR